MNELGDGQLPEKESLMRSIGLAGHQMDKRLDTALAPYRLSIAKLGVLRALLLSGEPLSLSQLAEQLACVKSNITQLVDRLEEDGLVRRIADLSDRRCKRAMLTTEGQRLYFVGARVEAQADAELFQSISSEERRQLRGLLARFAGQVPGKYLTIE